ncbi:hypothetical protein L6R53_30885, partial [Myxococcota bacterium]|nr:hypothetical protein [Myxococcota bacterium]
MSPSTQRSAASRGPRTWTAGCSRRARDPRGAHLASLGLACVLGAWAAARHLDFAHVDRALPVGDAPGHLAIALRWWRWWQDLDPFPPVEPLPPVVHLSLAWARQVAGDQLDDLHLAMAAWSALLVAAATWAAARGGAGLAGAALAGLVTLHAPHMTVVSRQFLLDGPATAVLLLALGAAWGSRGFRHPLRSLLAGLLVGALVVVKYSLLPWLLAPVLLWTLAILARHPAGWLPLLGTAGHLAWWGQQLWARRALQHLPVELPRAPLVHLALSLVV